MHFLAPPRLLQGLPPVLGSLGNLSMSVSCRVECHPLCVIDWFRNNESLTRISEDLRNNYYHMETVQHDIDERIGVFSSITSYLHIHNTSTIDDNDVFMCVSEDNGIGPSVTSSVIYRVECKLNFI